MGANSVIWIRKKWKNGILKGITLQRFVKKRVVKVAARSFRPESPSLSSAA